jgi:hypothetical protein
MKFSLTKIIQKGAKAGKHDFAKRHTKKSLTTKQKIEAVEKKRQEKLHKEVVKRDRKTFF